MGEATTGKAISAAREIVEIDSPRPVDPITSNLSLPMLSFPFDARINSHALRSIFLLCSGRVSPKCVAAMQRMIGWVWLSLNIRAASDAD